MASTSWKSKEKLLLLFASSFSVLSRWLILANVIWCNSQFKRGHDLQIFQLWGPLSPSGPLKWCVSKKPSQALSRLYRRQCLQINVFLPALAQFYTIYPTSLKMFLNFRMLCTVFFFANFSATSSNLTKGSIFLDMFTFGNFAICSSDFPDFQFFQNQIFESDTTIVNKCIS